MTGNLHIFTQTRNNMLALIIAVMPRKRTKDIPAASSVSVTKAAEPEDGLEDDNISDSQPSSAEGRIEILAL